MSGHGGEMVTAATSDHGVGGCLFDPCRCQLNDHIVYPSTSPCVCMTELNPYRH